MSASIAAGYTIPIARCELGDRWVGAPVEALPSLPPAICGRFEDACSTWDDLTSEQTRSLGDFLASAPAGPPSGSTLCRNAPPSAYTRHDARWRPETPAGVVMSTHNPSGCCGHSLGGKTLGPGDAPGDGLETPRHRLGENGSPCSSSPRRCRPAGCITEQRATVTFMASGPLVLETSRTSGRCPPGFPRAGGRCHVSGWVLRGELQAGRRQPLASS